MCRVIRRRSQSGRRPTARFRPSGRCDLNSIVYVDALRRNPSSVASPALVVRQLDDGRGRRRDIFLYINNFWRVSVSLYTISFFSPHSFSSCCADRLEGCRVLGEHARFTHAHLSEHPLALCDFLFGSIRFSHHNN